MTASDDTFPVTYIFRCATHHFYDGTSADALQQSRAHVATFAFCASVAVPPSDPSCAKYHNSLHTDIHHLRNECHPLRISGSACALPAALRPRQGRQRRRDAAEIRRQRRGADEDASVEAGPGATNATFTFSLGGGVECSWWGFVSSRPARSVLRNVCPREASPSGPRAEELSGP